MLNPKLNTKSASYDALLQVIRAEEEGVLIKDIIE